MNETREVRIPLSVFLFVVATLLTALGWAGSPRSEQNRPLLLMPDVKAVEDYRRMSTRVGAELNLVDGNIAEVLAGDPTDLFGQTRAAQNVFEEILRIEDEIDRSDAPPAMLGLKEQLSQAANTYLEAARLALRWVSVPETANNKLAAQKLDEARTGLDGLEKSLWLQKNLP